LQSTLSWGDSVAAKVKKFLQKEALIEKDISADEAAINELIEMGFSAMLVSHVIERKQSSASTMLSLRACSMCRGVEPS